MGIYSQIYYNLCQRNSQHFSKYGKNSGIHKHHIIPKHAGGKDEESNYTYLSVREHIIAHFLLWKINGNVNDLRSMHMLGAKLTSKQRHITGIWCKENQIGFWSASNEQRKEWARQGYEAQKDIPNSFYYWSTEEGRKKRSSMGGKASFESGNNKEWQYWISPEGQRKRASMGGKSHLGKRCMYKPGDITFIRVKKEDIENKLSEGYIFGDPRQKKIKSSDI